MMILLIISIDKNVQSAPCNSFPKIFGGNLADTGLYHIDAYNDYLALAGNTWDSSLTGISESLIAYVAVTSISTGGKYYWAKGLSLKITSNFVGLKFSSDGSLLIAHSHV